MVYRLSISNLFVHFTDLFTVRFIYKNNGNIYKYIGQPKGLIISILLSRRSHNRFFSWLEIRVTIAGTAGDDFFDPHNNIRGWIKDRAILKNLVVYYPLMTLWTVCLIKFGKKDLGHDHQVEVVDSNVWKVTDNPFLSFSQTDWYFQ